MDHCTHENFYMDVQMQRLFDEEHPDRPVIGWAVDLAFQCNECKIPFVFIGLPMGISPNEPRASATGIRARLPIKPVGEEVRNETPTMGLVQ